MRVVSIVMRPETSITNEDKEPIAAIPRHTTRFNAKWRAQGRRSGSTSENPRIKFWDRIAFAVILSILVYGALR
ncbi:hypothetical protein MNBD_ALPHA05-131 [hydrothermal vent metagenome]|uniref:Uncharacterized protein n=1 Tax=hydrothermal vent metagenome TaxID=652676 RepID=A0A3B0SSC3_9ZZZZ